MKVESAVTGLAALAQNSRLAIFRFLVERGNAGATPGELIAHFNFMASSLSFHLKALTQSGLVSAEQISRNITYRANYTAMQELIDFLTENCCGGDPSLCAPIQKKAVTRSIRLPHPPTPNPSDRIKSQGKKMTIKTVSTGSAHGRLTLRSAGDNGTLIHADNDPPPMRPLWRSCSISTRCMVAGNTRHP